VTKIKVPWSGILQVAGLILGSENRYLTEDFLTSSTEILSRYLN